jgi:hypothetical protein
MSTGLDGRQRDKMVRSAASMATRSWGHSAKSTAHPSLMVNWAKPTFPKFWQSSRALLEPACSQDHSSGGLEDKVRKAALD